MLWDNSATPAWPEFPTPCCLPLQQLSFDHSMKWNDQDLEKDVLHRSYLESEELCQHNMGRCLLWGREGAFL